MLTPDASLWLSALAASTRKLASHELGAAGARARPLVTVELRVEHGAWCAVLARDDQRVELGGLTQLIRYLELLPADASSPAVRGLR